MNLKNSLPIGSVVMVKGIKRKVMIFGYKQKRRGQNENASGRTENCESDPA